MKNQPNKNQTANLEDLVRLANQAGAEGIWLIRGATNARLIYEPWLGHLVPGAGGAPPAGVPALINFSFSLAIADTGVLVVMRLPADGGEPGIESRVSAGAPGSAEPAGHPSGSGPNKQRLSPEQAAAAARYLPVRGDYDEGDTLEIARFATDLLGDKFVNYPEISLSWLDGAGSDLWVCAGEADLDWFFEGVVKFPAGWAVEDVEEFFRRDAEILVEPWEDA